MANYYVSQGGSRILNATRVDQSGADNTNVIDWVKTNDFIIAININSNGKDTVAAQYKLRWRNKTDGGSFADVGAATEINYNATTDLVNGNPIAVGGRKCDSQGGDTWAAGEEVEGASLSDSIDLADEYETEIHFALDCSGATDAKEYEFELYDSTLGVTRGTCGATITMESGPATKEFTVDALLKTTETKEFTTDAVLSVEGWLPGWSYRKEITITGQSGAGTLYQVDLDIGDSAGGDFHLEGNCTNFPQDIQVADNDGTTLLDYWIEDITTDPIKMWVEVADDLGTNQTIYVYYGKSGATTDSDIEATFLLGDDFPGTSIDTGKWTVTGTVTVGSSEATLNEDDIIKSIATFGFETAVTAKSKADEQDSSFVGYFTDSNNRTQVQNSDYISNDDFDNITLTTAKASSYPSPYPQNQWSDFRNTYYQYTIKRISTSLIKYSQGSNSNTYTDSAHIPTGDMSVELYVWDSSQASTLIADWIFVRKCIDTEPAFSSAGSEETPGVAAETKEYTIDAILEATNTKEFSIDSILEATETKEFTVDSYLVDRLTKEFTVDAILEATNTKEFSIDALLSTTETKEFTLDSILVSTETKEFTTDAILEATFTKEFGIDGVLSGTATKEFTVDSILQATETKDFTTDSILVNRLTKEFTIDGLLVNRQTKDFSTDSQLVDRFTKEFTINGLLSDQFTKEFSTDAILQATEVKEFTIDSILQATETKEFTTDSILQATNTKTFSIDSVLTGGISKEFTINALLQATNIKEFTTDSILQATETKEFTTDGYLVDRLDKTFSINSILEATETKEFTVDGILSGKSYKEFSIDAILQATETKDFTTDGILVDRFTKNFTTDGILITSNNNKRRSVVGIFPVPDGSLNQLDRKHAAGFYRGPTYPLYSKLFSIDAVLVATQTKEFTTDGYFVDRLDKTFTTDALLSTTETKEFSIDTILQSTNTKEYTIDALLKTTETKEFTTDSLLVNRFIKSFAIDTLLTGTASKEFSIDAILESPERYDITIITSESQHAISIISDEHQHIITTSSEPQHSIVIIRDEE